jgi:hypothetical protein
LGKLPVLLIEDGLFEAAELEVDDELVGLPEVDELDELLV